MFTLPWIALFVLGSPFWWLLLFAGSCFLIRLIESEEFAGAFAVVCGWALLVTFFGSGVEQLKWVSVNPGHFISIIGAYIAVGAVWGIIKWYLYVCKKLDEYESLKYEWLKDKGVDSKTIPDSLKIAWLDYLVKNSKYVTKKKVYDETTKTWTEKPIVQVQPRAWLNKSRITSWMAYWPWSMFWTLLADVLRQVFEKIQKLLGNLMDSISNMVFKHVDSDFQTQDGHASDVIAKRDKERKAAEEAERAKRFNPTAESRPLPRE